MEIMRRVAIFIRVFVWWFFVRPIKKLVNRYIRGCYIEDNERNRQIVKYCEKIIVDHNYVPSNPVEHWVDNIWRNSAEEFYQMKVAEGYLEDDIPHDYSLLRPQIARHVYLSMMEMAIIKPA